MDVLCSPQETFHVHTDGPKTTALEQMYFTHKSRYQKNYYCIALKAQGNNTLAKPIY